MQTAKSNFVKKMWNVQKAACYSVIDLAWKKRLPVDYGQRALA
jgi:hypothetical protein